MAHDEWRKIISNWQQLHDLNILPSVDAEVLREVSAKVGGLPPDLVNLYSTCNGFTRVWFSVLPVEDPGSIKKTWNGICRANIPSPYSVFEGNLELHSRFIAFARLEGGGIGCIERESGKIWYEDEGELHGITLSLSAFIAACLKEMDCQPES